MLEEKITKNVILKNPTTNPIAYYVIQDGSDDFYFDKGDFRIEPKSTYEFPISVQTRLSKPVYGRIIFASVKDEGT